MRKLFKKSLACLLAAILCATVCIAAIPASAEAITYSTNAVVATPGETVNIDFTVANFSAVKGAMIKLYLPTAIASVDSVLVNGAEIAAFDEQTGAGYYKVGAENGVQYIKFMALFGDPFGELASVNGLTFNITATVAAEAAEGTYEYAAPVFSVTEDGTTLADVTGAFGTFEVKNETIVKFDMYGSNMTLGSSLLFNFFVKQSDITDTGSYAKITKTYADGRANVVTEVPYANWEAYGSNKYWKISFSGLAAKEVNDLIYIEIYDSKDNLLSNEYSDSVGSYCVRLFNASTTKTNAKSAAVDLLYFCAGAQQQFKYDLENMATNLITEAMIPYATAEASAENTQVKGANFYGTVLSIEDKNVMKMFFKNVDKDSMYAIITYTDYRGREQEYRIEGADFVQYNSTSYYGPAVDTLAYGDGYQDVTCTIYNADGTEYGSCVDSIESTAARLIAAYPENSFYPNLMKIVVSMRTYALNPNA